MAYGTQGVGQTNPYLVVNEQMFKTGLLNRLLHRDVDSVFAILKQTASATNLALGGINSGEYARRESFMIALQVIDSHTNQISTVSNNFYALKDRVDSVERQRNSDATFASCTSTAVNKHTEQLKEVASRIMALETLPNKMAQEHEEVQRYLKKLERMINEVGDDSRTSYSRLQLLFDDMNLHFKEMSLKVGSLIHSREELTATVICLKKEQEALSDRQHRDQLALRAEMAEISQKVNGVSESVVGLKSKQEEAARKQEKHENILIRSRELTTSLAEALASMGQEQRFLYVSLEVIGKKLDLVLDKNGIAQPKVETPSTGDPAAPFREILVGLRGLREAF